MTEWLARTSHNQISGPYSQEELCRRIREGEFSLDDEICPANGYWIFLHERAEVSRLLGMEVSKSLFVKSDEEVTETETERLNVPPEDVAEYLKKAQSKAPVQATFEHKEPEQTQSQVKSAVESRFFLRNMLWFLVVGGMFALFVFLRLLRTNDG